MEENEITMPTEETPETPAEAPTELENPDSVVIEETE